MAKLDALDVVARYTEALNAHTLERMQTLRAATYTLDLAYREACGASALGGDAAQAFYHVYFTAFPDGAFRATRSVVAEGLVIQEWVFVGTHTGPLDPTVFGWLQHEATGRTVRLRGVSLYDVNGGLLQRETVYLDLATLAVELGVGE